MLTGLKRLVKRSKKMYLKLGPVFAAYRNSVITLARGLGGINYNEAVFSSFNHQAYNDNPRYISEALHALRPQTEIVWLFARPHDAEKYDIPDYVRVVCATSTRGMAHLARARVVVDNFNKRFYLKFPGENQIYIQTWHGDRAFKKVGYDNPGGLNCGIEEKAALFICGSEYGEMQIHSAFHYHGEIMKVGYPRNDILLRNDPAEARAIRKKLGVDEDTRLLMYAPTFRDVDFRHNRVQRAHLELGHVLDTLEAATDAKWKCLVRAHYMSKGIDAAVDSRLIQASAYPEMGELLLISDALITDYSSCAGDYALLRRPIFLYQDDLDDYTGNNRALYFDMKDSPYWVADTPEAMDALIMRCTPESARENCEAILKFYGEAETGHAARSVAEYIADKLK